MGRRVEIRSYDPSWADRGRELCVRMKALLGANALAVYHIGATSVKGLDGRDIIDILAVVADMDLVGDAEGALMEEGFSAVGEMDDSGRRVFVRDEGEAAYLEICTRESGRTIRSRLAVRDYLRTHRAAREEYTALRRELADKYPEQELSYRLGKNETLLKLEKAAFSWKKAVEKKKVEEAEAARRAQEEAEAARRAAEEEKRRAEEEAEAARLAAEEKKQRAAEEAEHRERALAEGAASEGSGSAVSDDGQTKTKEGGKKSDGSRKKAASEEARASDGAGPQKRRKKTSGTDDPASSARKRRKKRPAAAPAAAAAAEDGRAQVQLGTGEKAQRPSSARGGESALELPPGARGKKTPLTEEEKAREQQAREEKSKWLSGMVGEEEEEEGGLGDGIAAFYRAHRRPILIAGIALVALLLVIGIALSGRHGVQTPDDEVIVESGETGLEETASTAPAIAAGDLGAYYNAGAASQDDHSVTILATGDNLIHSQIYHTAENRDGSYDFTPFYQNLKDFISSADIATINQETPMASDLYEPHGYPHFNSPKQVGTALIDAGFDIVNIGNNHILDMGPDGAEITARFWKNRDIPYVGFYTSWDDAFDTRVIEVNGIKVAFVSFVEMTNDELPADSDYLLAYMYDQNMVKEMLEYARARADIVVVHAHWGEESTFTTTDYVKEEAQRLVDLGADIIFGNHPHYLQDLTVLTRESDGALCPVIYSLGNFLSAQKERDALISGLLTVTVTRDEETGKVAPSAMGFLPIVTHYTTEDRDDVMLYPLAMYTEEMAAQHGVNTLDEAGPFTLDYIHQVLDTEIPTEYQNRMQPISAPEPTPESDAESAAE